jgi:hypothetical protein
VLVFPALPRPSTVIFAKLKGRFASARLTAAEKGEEKFE